MAEFRIEGLTDPSAAPAWFAQWSSLADEPELTFVFPKQRLRASVMVLLGAIAADRRSRGRKNRISGEVADNPVARLLLLVESDELKFEGAKRAFETLRPIVDQRTARQLSEAVADALTELRPPVSPSVVRMARSVFEELGANVVDHSGRPETGYGFVQVDPARHRLELAFADCGVGFRASLQRNPELQGRVADDAEAVQIAMSPRITGTQSPRTNMGIGLKLLADFSDVLGGDLWIASGSAMLHRKTTAGQRTNVIRSIPPWRGTWISLDAPVA